MRPDLVQLCHGLSGLDGLETLAMTSNGIKLERQLPELKAAGETSVSSLAENPLVVPFFYHLRGALSDIT